MIHRHEHQDNHGTLICDLTARARNSNELYQQDEHAFRLQLRLPPALISVSFSLRC